MFRHYNYRSLFPCGDDMVAIIDDREDVWNYSPNLVPVLPYKFFKGIYELLGRTASLTYQLHTAGLIQLISGTFYCMVRCTSITYSTLRHGFTVKFSSWTFSKTG